MGANEKPFSRFIPKEQVGTTTSWEWQSLNGGLPARGTEALLSEREQRAFARGQAQGYQAAQKEAQQQQQSYKDQVERVLNELRARFSELETQAADQLLEVGLEIARQVVRRELAVRPDALLPVVREAVTAVIEQHAQPRVYLHPHDYEIIRADLEADGTFKGCRFIPDASLARGGCRVDTHQTEVDATVQNRWRRGVDALGLDDTWHNGPSAP